VFSDASQRSNLVPSHQSAAGNPTIRVARTHASENLPIRRHLKSPAHTRSAVSTSTFLNVPGYAQRVYSLAGSRRRAVHVLGIVVEMRADARKTRERGSACAN
jgi:hypothetical protein